MDTSRGIVRNQQRLRVRNALVIVVALAALFCAGYVMPFDGDAGNASPMNEVAPATRLRKQDSAFSLLIEAYRQFHNHLIQSDYDRQRRAAARLPDRESRRQALALVERERDLRVRKLCTQLATFAVAYDYSRQRDQRNEGISVPRAVDADAAAEELKEFVVIVPPAGNSSKPGTIPADAVLRDKQPSR